MLRIRNKATIQELNLTADQINELDKIMSGLPTSKEMKKREVKRILNGSMCCICFGIPSVELRTPVGRGGIVIERYCTRCQTTIYERIKSADDKELAELYNIEIRK